MFKPMSSCGFVFILHNDYLMYVDSNNVECCIELLSLTSSSKFLTAVYGF